MDACLMAMIEGARELTPFADYFIGSQEVEPMDGGRTRRSCKP